MRPTILRVAAIGNYLPRQCGIATFTTDLCEAIAARSKDTTVFAVPVNDTEDGYSYPERVGFELAEKEVASYRRAADFLNINNVDIVCLQHEFGIFGGPAGSHILALLSELRMPVVTTLHTVLHEPDATYRKAMDEVAKLSDRLVVMSQRSREFLEDIYEVPGEKIDFIPHGIPDVAFVDPNYYKDQFGVEGKLVLLTFGLLSPNKGVENVVEALPAILEKHPNVMYMIVGATHPHLKREQGESYRLSLERLVQANGVEANVIFHNRFVSLKQLIEFIGAADIYVTPYLSVAQAVSGSLAYSVGAGKAVVSTPYWYAEELLADRRGILVPMKTPRAIAERVMDLLDDERERHAMRKRAYQLGRDMIWSKVAKQYMQSFERAREDRARKPRGRFVAKTLDKRPRELPLIKLDHLRRMTDDSGILTHAVFSVPDYTSGYRVEDNARALVLTVLLEGLGDAPSAEARWYGSRYLAFLQHAYNREKGRFRCCFSYDRQWLEEVGSENAHGRAMWALGIVAGRSSDPGLRGVAGRLFDEALPATLHFTEPRAWAYTLLGIQEYMRRFFGHKSAQDIRNALSQRLLDLYFKNSSNEWPWFEEALSECNGRLPHALFLCGQWLGRGDMVDAGLAALEWLVSVQRADSDYFVPIGTEGWYPRGGMRARFDQHPLEAWATVAACIEAYRMTSEQKWMREAQRAFDWFLGDNDLGIPLYNPTTGGCHDALTPDQVNQNQGAEATLCFLLAMMEMKQAESIIRNAEPDSS